MNVLGLVVFQTRRVLKIAFWKPIFWPRDLLMQPVRTFISITRRACVRQNYCDRAWGKVGIVFSLALENNFNQTEIAIFLCRLCFIKGFPFSQLNLTYYSWCLCGDCKMSPLTTPLCYYILLVLRNHELYVVYTWKRFCSCARGRQWCGIRLCFMRGFPFSLPSV